MKRYDLTDVVFPGGVFDHEMVEDPEGEWVRYEDIKYFRRPFSSEGSWYGSLTLDSLTIENKALGAEISRITEMYELRIAELKKQPFGVLECKSIEGHDAVIEKDGLYCDGCKSFVRLDSCNPNYNICDCDHIGQILLYANMLPATWVSVKVRTFKSETKRPHGHGSKISQSGAPFVRVSEGGYVITGECSCAEQAVRWKRLENSGCGNEQYWICPAHGYKKR